MLERVLLEREGVREVGHAKVGDLDMPFFVEEQIGGFDVAVDDPLVVD